MLFRICAGLEFSQVLSLTNGSLNTSEGCASISDKIYFFYTDGSTVYNKSHQIMTNGFGLLGIDLVHSLPYKTQKSLYLLYFFTVDQPLLKTLVPSTGTILLQIMV
jgi:hypothetical protein